MDSNSNNIDSNIIIKTTTAAESTTSTSIKTLKSTITILKTTKTMNTYINNEYKILTTTIAAATTPTPTPTTTATLIALVIISHQQQQQQHLFFFPLVNTFSFFDYYYSTSLYDLISESMSIIRVTVYFTQITYVEAT